MAVLGGFEPRLARVLKSLERELSVQILPDGGHLSRSPSLQLQVLQDLIDTRAVLRSAQIEVPAALKDAIERMAPMLRFFRHGDRRLALFNDLLEEDGVLIDLVLTRSETKGRAPSHAPDTGFDRLQAFKSLVLIDTGKPPPRGFDDHAHAGPLSFELSHERERIIVNCGAYRGPKPNWWRVARASAAHSVMVVADTNSVEIRADGTLGRTPTSVARERAEHEGQQWVSATHDGYRERFGLIYARQLFLSADGEDLRGEDRLTGLPGAAFAVRFHLHPSVQAALVRDGSAALLRMPSGDRVAAARRRRRDESRRKHLSRLRRGEKDAAGGAERDRAARGRHGALGDSPRAAQVHRGSGRMRISFPGSSFGDQVFRAIQLRESGSAGFLSRGSAARQWVRPPGPRRSPSRPACSPALTTRVLIPILARREILDRPNERSSHQVATPRGGGIAVIGSVLLAWICARPNRIGALRRLRDCLGRRFAGGGFMARRFARPFPGRAIAGAGCRRGDRHLFCPARPGRGTLSLPRRDRPRLDLVDQSVQLHGRDRRARRQRGRGDRRRLAAVRERSGPALIPRSQMLAPP